MATLTMNPSRSPLIKRGTGRVRSWQKVNNDKLMNQFKDAVALPLKRCAASDSDAENVDPLAGKQPTKRKRSVEGDDDLAQKPAKYPRTLLNSIESSLVHEKLSRASTPVSRPTQKPAGRSPPPKSFKVFGRRSTHHAARLEKAGRHNAHRAPFSISAALSFSNVSSLKKKGLTRSKPTWFFNIHADSEQEEMTNLVQHSTCVLDISDDEGKSKMNGRGKENIPPIELDVPMVQQTPIVPVSRKTLVSEDPRAPLGELDAVVYYAPGCDANAFVAIYDDEEPEEATEKRPLIPSLTKSVPQPSLPQPTERFDPSIISSLQEATATQMVQEDKPITEPTEAEIEIWESGSAAEEAATAAAEGFEPTNIFASD